MAEDTIGDIRGLLTEIKPLVSRKTEPGSDGSTAQANALHRLSLIRSELERVKRHLAEWTPGPSETK